MAKKKKVKALGRSPFLLLLAIHLLFKQMAYYLPRLMGDNKYQSTAKLNKLEYQLLLIRFNAHMGPSENSSGQKKE